MSIKKIFKKKALNVFFRCIDQEHLLSILLKINYGAGADITVGGEGRNIRKILKKLEEKYPNDQYVLFDVGANIGNYSKELRCVFSGKADIHAFEPLPSTYNMLKKEVESYHINCYNVGLSDKEGVLPFYIDKQGSRIASVYHRRLDHFNVKMDITEDCNFTTVDEFCANNNLERIHFLKIDVEGHELAVLGGANKMIEDGRIDFIQFEFGGCNIDSRTFFQDFWYFLHDKYDIYRIIPTGLYPIKEYTEMREIFMCSNYLAELKTR